MSHWSESAKSKDGKGMRDQKAGDPVHPCVENARLLPVFDTNERTVLDPEVRIAPLPPPLESSLTAEPPAPPLESELHVLEEKK